MRIGCCIYLLVTLAILFSSLQTSVALTCSKIQLLRCLKPQHFLSPLYRTMSTPSKPVVTKVERLPNGPMQTPDPFLFCVYHKDEYPAGDAKMQAPRKGNGADFDPDAPYRMYHGDRVPGFPQHPHRGFETVTATIDGIIDHTDSAGCAGRYGQGDLQWMTAGKGVVHGEMFPLINADRPNPTKFFQIWLNLPARNKMVEPAFEMHWANTIGKVDLPEDAGSVTVWAGELNGVSGQAPPPNSWAADPQNDVAIWFITIKPGKTTTLPAARSGDAANRSLYIVESGQAITVSGRSVPPKSYVSLRAGSDFELVNTSPDTDLEVLMLQGRPIGEPVAQHGPFVMNTRAEIMQAFADYQRTSFGGWPWPQDAMIFPREQGRFAQRGLKAEKEHPTQ